MHEPGYEGSAFDANMYLAEDRILCFEIVTKKREAWVLKYVKSAKASTDAPNAAAEYISQRRRWLNGAFFACLYSVLHFYRIWTSGHNILRCFWLNIEFVYNAIVMGFTFLGPANFYLAFFFLAQSAVSNTEHDPFFGQGSNVLEILTNLYLALLFVILICSLGNRPQGTRFAYIGCMVVFGLLFCVALYCAGWTIYFAVPHTLAGWKDFDDLIRQPAFRDIVISLGATYGLYIYSSILHAEPWHLLTSFLQYMFLLPSTINILSIYSFCNLHDVSWGTKGQTTPAALGGAKTGKEGKVEVDLPTNDKDVDNMWLAMRKDLSVKTVEVKEKRSASVKQEDHMRAFRTNVVLTFALCNIALVLVFTSSFFLKWANDALGTRGSKVNPYMTFIFWAVAGMAAFRAVGTTLYMVLRLIGQ